MKRIRLTKRESLTDETSEAPLRTTSVEGELLYLPEVGKSVVVLAPPLDPIYDYRAVTTSRVVQLTHDVDTDTYMAWTENSLYQIELLGEEE